MKRLATVLLLAAVFSLIALFFIYPESIEKLWLWVVGLIGAIIAFIQKAGDWIENQINRFSKKETEENPLNTVSPEDVFMKIFRYSRSGNRIFGLVYIGEKFVGISSENTSNNPGKYKLGIKGTNITISGDNGFSTKLGTPQGSGITANDIILSADTNSSETNADLIFNSVFELLADWTEKEKQSWLEIYNTDQFVKS